MGGPRAPITPLIPWSPLQGVDGGSGAASHSAGAAAVAMLKRRHRSGSRARVVMISERRRRLRRRFCIVVKQLIDSTYKVERLAYQSISLPKSSGGVEEAHALPLLFDKERLEIGDEILTP